MSLAEKWLGVAQLIRPEGSITSKFKYVKVIEYDIPC